MKNSGYARPKKQSIGMFGVAPTCEIIFYPQQKWKYEIRFSSVYLKNEKNHINIHAGLDWFNENFKEVDNE
mgnify:CR=1 FL=1